MGFLEAKLAGNFLSTSVSMDVSLFTFHFYICLEGQHALVNFNRMFQTEGQHSISGDEWTFIGHSLFTGLDIRFYGGVMFRK